MASLTELENFIDGQFVLCSHHIDSYNPATGEIHLKVPDSGEEEIQLAVEAAQRAFKKCVCVCVISVTAPYCCHAFDIAADGPRLRHERGLV